MTPGSQIPPDHPARAYLAERGTHALQAAIIPWGDEYILASAYGSHRTVMCIGTGPEILAELEANWAKALTASDQRRANAAAMAAAREAEETATATEISALAGLKIEL